jgi:hypothetical protein
MIRCYFVFGDKFSNFRLLSANYKDIKQARIFTESNNCKLFLTAEEAAFYMNAHAYERRHA